MRKEVLILGAIVLALALAAAGALFFLGGFGDFSESASAGLEQFLSGLKTVPDGDRLPAVPDPSPEVLREAVGTPGRLAVNLVLCGSYEEKDGYLQLHDLFSWNYTGDTGAFKVYADISNCPAGSLKYRMVLTDPEGTVLKTTAEDFYDVAKEGDGFYQVFDYENMNLPRSGVYLFNFQLKIGENFETVAAYPMVVRE